MTTLALINALLTLLRGDRDGTDAAVQLRIPGRNANAAAWPADAEIRLDPRVLFDDAIKVPQVRLCIDPDGATRDSLANGGRIVQHTEKLLVGFARRVDGETEFGEFLEWGEYLFDLLTAVTSIDNWTRVSPGEWAYRWDGDSLSAEATTSEATPEGTTMIGTMYALFSLEWSCVK